MRREDILGINLVKLLHNLPQQKKELLRLQDRLLSQANAGTESDDHIAGIGKADSKVGKVESKTGKSELLLTEEKPLKVWQMKDLALQVLQSLRTFATKQHKNDAASGKKSDNNEDNIEDKNGDRNEDTKNHKPLSVLKHLQTLTQNFPTYVRPLSKLKVQTGVREEVQALHMSGTNNVAPARTIV